MSHKHKRRIEDENKISRPNVFDRLGESKKERGDWEMNMHVKNIKTQRPNNDRYEGGHSSRDQDQWSSNRGHHMQSSSKVVKSKRPEYVDNYKQDQRRYEDEHQAMKYIRSNEKVVAKRPAPPMDFSDENERKRKKKYRSPDLSPGSPIPPTRLKHESKRAIYRSPSPALYPADREQKRGRSKERKSKKVKETVGSMKVVKPSKPSYDLYDDSANYKSNIVDQHYKKPRNIDTYEQAKYRKEPQPDQYKQKKRIANVSPTKHQRDHNYRDDIEDNQRYRDDGIKEVQRRSKSYKEELIYETSEILPMSRKKVKSNELTYDDQLQKKKVRSDKEDLDSRYINKLDDQPRDKYASRDKGRKLKSDQYTDDNSSRRSSPAPVKFKDNKTKQYSKVAYNDDEKQVKVKKKKKEVVVMKTVEVQKRKKIKQKANDVPSRSKKKPSLPIVQDEVPVKSKKAVSRKQKRTRDPSTSSSSSATSSSSSSSEDDSQSEGEIRSKKSSRSARGSWDPRYSDALSPDRTYKKRSSYENIPIQVNVEKHPQPKRPKLEVARRESPESASSRTGSRYQVSPLRQTYKRQDRSYERPAYSNYDSRKDEKMMVEVDPRRDRILQSGDFQKRSERHLNYPDHKSDRIMDKYEQAPVDVPYKQHSVEKKGYYGTKTFSKYVDKQVEQPYDDKRNYARREQQGFHDKKMHYEERGDPHPIEVRKQRPYQSSHDNRPPLPHHPDPNRRSFNQKQSGDMRGAKERQAQWQPDRVKKQKDPSGLGSGVKRISTWTDGRDGNKMRVNTRDSQPYHNNRDPHVNRVDNYRQGRADQRDPTRPVNQDHQAMRPITRKPTHEKWGTERVQYDDNRNRFKDNQLRPQQNLRIQEERSSPAFYREVRQSRESKNRDLGIEITIRDDRGRSANDYEKKRNVKGSPLRKVSSYEMSRRDRAPEKVSDDRNLAYSQAPGDVGRYKHIASPRDKNQTSKYPHHGSRDAMQQSQDYREGRDYMRRHDKHPDIVRPRSKEEKYYKGGQMRPLSDSDRSRPSSVVDRVRSRDSSGAAHARSRDSSRDKVPRSSRDDSRSRKEVKIEEKKPKATKTRLPDKDSHKDRSESRKHNSKIKISEKKSKPSSKKEEKSKGKPEAADVLEVDWAGISTNEKKTTINPPGSILNKFSPASLLARMGVSTKLLPPDVVEEVKKTCEQDQGSTSLVLSHDLGALNCAEYSRRKSWLDTFNAKSCRLTSFDDAAYRQRILEIDEDSRYPYQPPVIINAHTYASSIKHYLAKTKLTVGG